MGTLLSPRDNNTVVAERQHLGELAECMKNLPDEHIIKEGFPLEHYFAHKTYVRVMTMKADELVLGKIHRHSGITLLLKGTIAIVHTGGEKTYRTAPCVWVTPGGAQKAVYAVDDVMLATAHGVETQDIPTIEREVTVDSYEEYDAEQKLLR